MLDAAEAAGFDVFVTTDRNLLSAEWLTAGSPFALTSALRTTGVNLETNLLPLGTNDPHSATLLGWPVLVVLMAALMYVNVAQTPHPVQ